MACLTGIAYLNFRGGIVAMFMLLGMLFFTMDLASGNRRYTVWFMKAFFLLWNFVVIASMHFVWKYEVFLLSN